MLVPLNKGAVAMFVSPTNPLGIEVYSYAKFAFVFVDKYAHSISCGLCKFSDFVNLLIPFPDFEDGIKAGTGMFCVLRFL